MLSTIIVKSSSSIYRSSLPHTTMKRGTAAVFMLVCVAFQKHLLGYFMKQDAGSDGHPVQYTKALMAVPLLLKAAIPMGQK